MASPWIRPNTCLLYTSNSIWLITPLDLAPIRPASRRQSCTVHENSIPTMKSPSRNAATASKKTKVSKLSRSAPANTAASMTAEDYIDAARSAVTKRAYAADLAHFLANGGKLPATPQQLSAYLAKLAATLAVATIERRLIGIHRAHQDLNMTSPAVHAVSYTHLDVYKRQAWPSFIRITGRNPACSRHEENLSLIHI